jgi:UDP-N-acetyl-D-galactosamine dehydrogenase
MVVAVSGNEIIAFEPKKVVIIGLGYVGLPLLSSISKFFECSGYDISLRRINEIKSEIDITNELGKFDLKRISKLELVHGENNLPLGDTYIVTVPTPIDSYNVPDLDPLKSACEIISRNLKKGDLVIFESTVYPGCTEEYCKPILEKLSDLKEGSDFYIGYSPERINPGDSTKPIESITKIVSGSNQHALERVIGVYSKIIEAGLHKTSSIKIAETAKVIENIQRDINIGLMNELSKICIKIGIDTNEVIDAASTKWNFLNFRPGLVGGHCIGVDPYYLTHKCSNLGFNPEIILSGRRTNDSMPSFIASEITKRHQNINNLDKEILILGATFKENCPDTRNSKIFDLSIILKEYGFNCDIEDPYAGNDDRVVNYKQKNFINQKKYDVLILAVKHDIFKKEPYYPPKNLLKENGLLVDIKNFYPRSFGAIRL